MPRTLILGSRAGARLPRTPRACRRGDRIRFREEGASPVGGVGSINYDGNKLESEVRHGVCKLVEPGRREGSGEAHGCRQRRLDSRRRQGGQEAEPQGPGERLPGWRQACRPGRGYADQQLTLLPEGISKPAQTRGHPESCTRCMVWGNCLVIRVFTSST